MEQQGSSSQAPLLPPGAAHTIFEGTSLWLELPALQSAVDWCASEMLLSAHPAHLTLLYNLPAREAGYYDELRRLGDRLRGGGWALSLRPTGLKAGVSGLFHHGFADLFFAAEGGLAALFEEAMAVFEHRTHAESFAGAPHACLAYARDPAPFEDGSFERALRERHPGLLKRPLAAEVCHVALWRTQGTTAEWRRLARIELRAEGPPAAADACGHVVL